MALTTQQNGTTVGGLSNQARASWWNDFKDLLTGVMNDQSVALNYRPGSGTTPTLTLKGDGFGPLLKAFKPDNTTQAALLDSNGNLTILGNFTLSGSGGMTWNGTLGGANKAVLTMVPTDVSTKNWGLYYNVSDNSLSFFDATDSVTALRLFTTGNAAIAGTLTVGGSLVWTAANDGPASGMDADTVDGSHASAFALLSGATFTGAVSMGSTLAVTGNITLQSGKNAFYAATGVTGKFTAQTTAPTSPATGDLWLDTSTVL